jgi:hypothetical protein
MSRNDEWIGGKSRIEHKAKNYTNAHEILYRVKYLGNTIMISMDHCVDFDALKHAINNMHRTIVE